jgi:hypothetical protein
VQTGFVRRLVPWALLGLLGGGVVVGAVVGALGSPSGSTSGSSSASAAGTPASAAASAWVAHVLATTAEAGTAHFTYSHVTVSKNPLLHDVLTGSGVIDFATGDVHVTEVDSQPSLTSGSSGNLKGVLVRTTAEEIGIGRTMYQAVAQEGTPNPVWMKLTQPRDPHAVLGLQMALNASVALDGLGGTQRVVGLTDLGHAVVGGVATRSWRVQTAPVCASALSGPSYETQEPTIVWVDAHGRLVQVTTVVHSTGKLTAEVLKAIPSLARVAGGAATTTDTLRFSAFGAPVQIAAPTHVVSIPSTSTGFAIAGCSSGSR